jgi:predicted RNase H-like HicB family nuclease
VKSYIFRVELVEEDDGRWSAGVSALPGCATWGHTREEALRNIRDAVEAYVRDMQKAGTPCQA